jgi:hypothetical protein
MKSTLLSLLATLLLFNAASAEETAVATDSIPSAHVALKVQLLEIPTMLAIASGFDEASALEPDGASSMRFEVFHSGNPVAPHLAQVLADPNTKILVESQVTCSSGFPFALTQMKPIPAGSGPKTELAKPDPEQPQFPGMMGYFFRFKPTVDDKGYITMPMYMLLQSPRVARDAPGIGDAASGMQAVNTSLRFASGTTICVANVVPEDYRTALASAFRNAATPGELPIFPAVPPAAGTTTYLLVTPTVVQNN